MLRKPYIFTMLALVFAMALGVNVNQSPVYAKTSISVSPMYQTLVLLPGEKTPASFTVFNPASNDQTLNYEVTVRPFWTDNENNVDFTEHEDYSRMTDWITIDRTTGSVEPNEKNEINFYIEVPEDAPAGGQYASIVVKSTNPRNIGGMISENYEMAHLVYAEVAGQTIRKGDIASIDLPGFLFSGNITGGASVQNEGNVHSNAIHVLEVLPLFGNEEYFTNAESPQENLIMPGGSRYTSVSWEETPSFGIFRVRYSVEFEGIKRELSKLVIVCPLWLLILVSVIIAVLIIKIITTGKKKAHHKSAEQII